MIVMREIKYVEEVQLSNILMSPMGDDIRSCKMCFLAVSREIYLKQNTALFSHVSLYVCLSQP